MQVNLLKLFSKQIFDRGYLKNFNLFIIYFECLSFLINAAITYKWTRTVLLLSSISKKNFHIKVTGLQISSTLKKSLYKSNKMSESVCVYVAENFAKHWTVMILFFKGSAIRSREGLCISIFGGGQIKIITLAPWKYFYCF